MLPVGRFGSILRESSDATFRIESDSEGTTIRGERSQFKLPSREPADFPAIAEFGETSFYELSARLFRELIRRTIFATDNESSRYALGGVKLEWKDNLLTAVGTDGRRLAKMEGPAQAVGQPAPFGDVTVVPTRAMQLLERALAEDGSEVQIAVRQNDILVKNPRATIYSRLLEGRYPRWRDVFPQRPSSVKIDLTVGPCTRPSARRRSSPAKKAAASISRSATARSCSPARRPKSASRASSCRSPTTASRSRSRSTRGSSSISSKCSNRKKSFTIDLQDSDAAAVCTTDDGYGYVIMPLARDR